jgi:hypothetical protein
VKVVVDEMWTPTIAAELRKRHFDVIAVNEPAHAGRYAGILDDEVFARAQTDGRAIVTDNIPDYEKARLDWEAHGAAHHGVIYALNPPFNRHRGDAVIGQMVRALEHFLSSPEAAEEPFNRAHYLRPAPG